MRELDSYLNDHLAGSVGALELIDHWIELCDGKPLAKVFSELRKDIEADQKSLREFFGARWPQPIFREREVSIL
jgi:hypothetical protein